MPTQPLGDGYQKHFFISFTKADRAWADWVAWELEAAGYSVEFQPWDFGLGTNIPLKMKEAAARCERTIAILSPDYLKSAFAQAEWAAAFMQDPSSQRATLLPIRVRKTELSPLDSAIGYLDLTTQKEPEAHAALLEQIEHVVMQTRGKPDGKPLFPGTSAAPAAVSSATPPPFPRIRYLPHTLTPYFTGREDVLATLHTALHDTKAAALGQMQSQAISGLGGIGKTQTALEYARRHADEYDAILWSPADSREALSGGFVRLAGVLNLPERETPDQSVVIEAARRWLREHDNWLLILDNADDPAMTTTFLNEGALPLVGAVMAPRGHLLLTTRAATAGAIHCLPLDVLPPDEAAALLLDRCGLTDPTEEQRRQAEEIAALLGGLPLALNQAGAFIAATGCGLDGYPDCYRDGAADLLALRGDNGLDHPDPVGVTWLLSFQKVREVNPAAAELLNLLAFLAPDDIPEEIITEGAEHLGDVLAPVAANAAQLNIALGVLRRYSLVQRNAEAKTLAIHRLVQAVLKAGMDTKIQHVWLERIMGALASTFPVETYAVWPKCQRLLLQANNCLNLPSIWDLQLESAISLANNVGAYLYVRGDYAEASALLERSLGLIKSFSGEKHAHLGATCNNLARVYVDQERYEEAELLFTQALAIAEQVMGPEHLEVATVCDNLAGLYSHVGRYYEAEALLLRALSIKEKVLGTEHHNVAVTCHNLAGLYIVQGRYNEAEELYLKDIGISEKVFTSPHPDTATSYHDLAMLYLIQGDHEKAEPLIQKAIIIGEVTFGTKHPRMGDFYYTQAYLYDTNGNDIDAYIFYNKAWNLLDKRIPPNSVYRIGYLSRYAAFLQRTGRTREAKLLLDQVRGIKNRDRDRSDTPTSMPTTVSLLHKKYSHINSFWERKKSR